MNTDRKIIKSVPIIDVGALRGNDRAALNALAEEIAEACRTIGFFYVVNTGVDPTLRDRVMKQVAALFDLPAEEKWEMDIQKSKYMRGYFSFGADKSDGINGDIKEGFDMALDLPASDPYVQQGLPFYGPNTWPRSLPAFKTTLNEYYSTMIALGGGLLRAFSIGLGVDEHYFTERFVKPIAQIRLLRYPEPEASDQLRIGAGEHTDFGWLTMIMQDETGGLQVQNTAGEWIDVPYIPQSFVVNVGDLMSRWTNDLYPATMHRVINRADRPRYSVAFFMDPDYHAMVECLPTCMSDTRPARYPAIVAGEYMDRRFLETTTFRDPVAATS